MKAIGDKRSSKWLKLRKQVLAYKDRVEQRRRDKSLKELMQRRYDYIVGTIEAVEDIVPPEQFRKILVACKQQMPVLNDVLKYDEKLKNIDEQK